MVRIRAQLIDTDQSDAEVNKNIAAQDGMRATIRRALKKRDMLYALNGQQFVLWTLSSHQQPSRRESGSRDIIHMLRVCVHLLDDEFKSGVNLCLFLDEVRDHFFHPDAFSMIRYPLVDGRSILRLAIHCALGLPESNHSDISNLALSIRWIGDDSRIQIADAARYRDSFHAIALLGVDPRLLATHFINGLPLPLLRVVPQTPDVKLETLIALLSTYTHWAPPTVTSTAAVAAADVADVAYGGHNRSRNDAKPPAPRNDTKPPAPHHKPSDKAKKSGSSRETKKEAAKDTTSTKTDDEERPPCPPNPHKDFTNFWYPEGKEWITKEMHLARKVDGKLYEHSRCDGSHFWGNCPRRRRRGAPRTGEAQSEA